MEKKIFTEIIARLRHADSIAYIATLNLPALKDIMWFEDQFADFQNEKENNTLPFDLPAIAIEFGPTKYTRSNGINQSAEGEVKIHLAQRKMVDGVDGAASLDSFKSLLDYQDAIIDSLNAFQLPCSAKPYMIGTERDHTNKLLMIDKITFAWSGRRHKPEGVPD
jgi:hypothetical protein